MAFGRARKDKDPSRSKIRTSRLSAISRREDASLSLRDRSVADQSKVIHAVKRKCYRASTVPMRSTALPSWKQTIIATRKYRDFLRRSERGGSELWATLRRGFPPIGRAALATKEERSVRRRARASSARSSPRVTLQLVSLVARRSETGIAVRRVQAEPAGSEGRSSSDGGGPI